MPQPTDTNTEGFCIATADLLESHADPSLKINLVRHVIAVERKLPVGHVCWPGVARIATPG